MGRERLRQLLARHEITFQRTKTWKESNDPDRDAKLARIEHVIEHFPDRVFAFDEFGPLTIRPHGGAAWAPRTKPDRLPANYHKLHGVRQFHGCYSRRRRHDVGRRTAPQERREHPRRAAIDPGSASGRRADLRDPGQPVRAQRPEDPRLGARNTRSSCASPRPTPPGPTRSRRTSGRCAPSSSPARTTPTTAR